MLVPASLALVVEAFPGPRRSHAIGLWGATAAVAAGLGPPTGGALVELGGWRWAFLVNIPFGLAALLAGRSQLVESRAPGRRRMPDLVGAGLLAVALALLNLGIIKGSDWGWGSAAVARVVRRHRCPGASCSASARGGTARRCSTRRCCASRRSRSPRPPRSSPASASTPTCSPTSSGCSTSGGTACCGPVWPWCPVRWSPPSSPRGSGPLADRYGYRPFVVPGALVWAGAYLWYHQQVGLVPAFWAEWLPGQVLSGIGVGATLPLLGSAALAAVPGGRYATASAVVSSARQLGGVLGIALLVVILGDPTPATAVAAFHDGWVLSIVAFLVVAVVALPLGRLRPAPDAEEVTEGAGAAVRRPDSPPAAVEALTVDGVGDRPVRRAAARSAAGAGQAAARGGHPACVPSRRASGCCARATRPGRRTSCAAAASRSRSVAGWSASSGPARSSGSSPLLTGERRSAGVRARRDSSVLEVPRDAFDEMLGSDPVATRVVLGQVAERLRTAGGGGGRGRTTHPAGGGGRRRPAPRQRRHRGCRGTARPPGDAPDRGRPRRGRPGRAGAGRAGPRPGAAAVRQHRSCGGRGLARLLPSAGRRRRAGRPQ